MQVKRIKCPKCGIVLDVKNSKAEEEKRIVCPKCKVGLKVRFPKPVPKEEPKEEPLTAHTVYAPQTLKPTPQNDGATQLGGMVTGTSNNGTTQIAPPQSIVRKAVLECNGGSYELELGDNTIGRKAKTSQATLQIDTTDRYMSRQHALITIRRLPDGDLKSVLHNDQNKNDTLINGHAIANGDEIRLINGTRITMGRTTLTYKEV